MENGGILLNGSLVCVFIFAIFLVIFNANVSFISLNQESHKKELEPQSNEPPLLNKRRRVNFYTL